ncbi:MAG: CAP domain-containing protein [Defluviitaleaceae bacterium]|nr:CAP domain-containing protein [Defluviitaleaceae bacterium]
MTEYERKIFELTNTVRPRFGLEPLIWDDGLAEIARAHSRDLAENNIFSHAGSDGSSPEQRVRKAGVAARFMGENISAGRHLPEAAMRDWMNSDGHRANILHNDAIYLGVGAVYLGSSKFKFYVTQIFGR